MPMLYLPKSGDAIVVELIAKISEVEVEEADPTRKNGKKMSPAVNVTLINAHLIEVPADNDEVDEIPFYDTYTGADVAVLLAYRNTQIIRVLPTGDVDESGEPIVLELPLPKSMMVKEEVEA